MHNEEFREHFAMQDKMYEMLIDNTKRTIRIETALYPTLGQPSRIDDHEKRLSAMEHFRAYVTGAWAILMSLFTWHIWSGK